MFSLLALVVTVLVLGSAMLWRGIRALPRSAIRPRAIGRRRVYGNASLPAPVSGPSSSTAAATGGHVPNTSSTSRW